MDGALRGVARYEQKVEVLFGDSKRLIHRLQEDRSSEQVRCDSRSPLERGRRGEE